jgi:hypothetical protein
MWWTWNGNEAEEKERCAVAFLAAEALRIRTEIQKQNKIVGE